MAAEVGGLLVNIGMDVATLRKDVGKAQRELSGFRQKVDRQMGKMQRSFKKATSGLRGLVAIVGAGALVRGINRTARSLEEVNRQAKALGASRETIQELAFTFARFDLQSNDVSDALGTLSDRAQDAKDGMKSFQEDFALVGIEVDDLRNKRPGELFELMAAKVAQIEDPTRRTAAVVRIFGDDLGRKLLPLLLQGQKGLDDYKRAAREAGAVQSDELVKSGAEAAKVFRELRETVDAQFTSAVAENAESFKSIASAMAEIVKLGGGVVGFFTDLGKALGIGAAKLSGAGSTTPFEDQITAIEKRLRRLNNITFKSDTTINRIEQLKKKLAELKQAQLGLLTSGSGGKSGGAGEPDVSASVGGGSSTTDRPSFGGANALIGGASNPAGGPMLANEAFRRLGGKTLPKANEETETFSKLMERIDNQVRETNRNADRLGFTFASAFEDAIVKGQGLRATMQGLLQDIARIALRMNVTKPLGNALSGAIAGGFGGGSSGTAGTGGSPGPVKAFAGGGFTGSGSRTGGVDGKGGFPAVLHPNETVIDHKAGGNASKVNIGSIDLRGASPAAVAKLEQMLLRVNASIEGRAVRAMFEAQARS